MDRWQHFTGPLQSFLLRVVDVGIAGSLFLAPLFMGGRHPLGKLVLVSLVAVTAVAWCAKQCLAGQARWTRSGAELLLLAGLGLTLFQITPLPQSLLLKLSPTIGELLPLWTTGHEQVLGFSPWSQLSLTPYATRSALAMYLAYTLLFLVTVQRTESLRDLERLARWLALAAVAMAVLGLAQFLFGNGKFLWVYQAPYRDTSGAVKGSFHNQNHFAHFLALGIGPLIWWLWRAKAETSKAAGSLDRKDERNPRQKRVPCSPAASSSIAALLPIGLGLVCFAGLLTFSRGGVLAMLTAGLVSMGCFYWLGLLEKQTSAKLAGVCAVLAVALLIFGYEPLTRRWTALEQARSLDDVSRGRKVLWESHARIIPNFLLTGTGLGSHRQIYPTYLDEHFNVTFTYGESGYLQLLVESGVLGLLLVLAGISLGLGWCLRPLLARQEDGSLGPRSSAGAGRTLEGQSVRLKACAAAFLGSLVASALHSLFDFAWYIPACMSLTVITLACACRAGQLYRSQSDRPCSRDLSGSPCRGKDERAASAVPDGSRFNDPRLVATPGQSCQLPRDGDLPWPRFGARAGRPIWLAVTATTLAVAWLMVKIQLPAARAAPHWERYQRIAQQWQRQQGQHDDPDGYVQQMAAALEQAVRCDPNRDEGRLKLASVYLLRFDSLQQRAANRMPLLQIREAVWASHFPSAEARDQWLSIAVGENLQLLKDAHLQARTAVRLCPLQGEAYVYLGGLAFLISSDQSIKTDYVRQALRVRPHEGAVLVAAGGEAALAGDPERAFEFWRKAFHRDQQSQSQIIETVAPLVPATVFLEQFTPGLDGISVLYAYYRRQNLDENARHVGEKYVALLQRQAQMEMGEPAARLWHRAFTVQAFLGNGPQALDCIRRAVQQMPADLGMHRDLARQLLAEERFDEGIREIEWCVRRDPKDETLQTLLAQAHRLRLAKAAEPRQVK